jgi:hypothetical protein
MKDTPETQEAVERWNQGKINAFDEMARLERERDDYMERCRTALSERDSWRMRAEQKYAMRRELEELLGVDRNDASDEQFKKGLDAIKNIIRERDEAIQRRMETILQCELYEQERDRLRQLLVADSERVDAYLGVCTERDEAQEERDRYKRMWEESRMETVEEAK